MYRVISDCLGFDYRDCDVSFFLLEDRYFSVATLDEVL